MTEHNTKLTSAEIACTWTGYMNDSMSKCILGYFLKHIEDKEIKSIVQMAYNLSAVHVEKLRALFQKEEIPLPIGFTNEHDVNKDTGRLYTDTFILTYVNHMAKVGMLAFSGFLSMSARKDIRLYFKEGLQEASNLYDESSDIALSKGLFVRAPYIAYPTQPDTIDNKSYLSGFSFFSKERPLNAIEISHLYMNIQTNIIGSKLALSFAQTSQREKIQKWMLRGAEISEKHVQIFGKALLENHIQPPVPHDIAISDLTTPVFSDRLAMFQMSFLSAAGTGNYATAAAASQRSDLVINYERLSLEIGQYAKDGADIMIHHKWLEQPPGTQDKEQLATKKE
ncbi:DUF3231 family protein [Priestia megaterium]|uniref:DUF3231 family protein n=1 Tax=Priestia megaterium TaxID=1404 RepID=UPI002731F713|nr:DUF3231 family protein [Priestia megaterium]MDP1383597.1 DUF3231 family protein [Priestia megaterium]MDP1427747.1 DUF3231 family protein [Priestia megaterium]